MKKFRVVLLAATLVGGFWLFTSGAGRKLIQPLSRVGRLWSEPEVARTAGLTADELNNIEIYKAAREATVYISSTVYQRTWFFEVSPVRELGSGFLISEDGRILTNFHVISGSSKIEVTLPDGTRTTAEVLAPDRSNDLALIKISPKKKLPYLRLGDSEKLQVGQKVLAIGNPFGLDWTLTTGVVSALDREIQDEGGRSLQGMVQTDAAINSGNSGGPLLDSSGNVIGVNTAIYGPSGGSIGIGFAMPINRAKSMLNDYQTGRSFKRPRIGVSTVFVAGDLAEALDLPSSGGLLIQEVASGSPADGAGLRGARRSVSVGNVQLGVGGDLITAIDGKPADRKDAIVRILGQKRPGDIVEVTVFRGGKTVKVPVRLGEAEERL